MTGFVIYKSLTEAEIREDLEKAKKQIHEWFDKKPDRKLCKAQLWYGNIARIHRKRIDKDLELAAEKAIKHKDHKIEVKQTDGILY